MDLIYYKQTKMKYWSERKFRWFYVGRRKALLSWSHGCLLTWQLWRFLEEWILGLLLIYYQRGNDWVEDLLQGLQDRQKSKVYLWTLTWYVDSRFYQWTSPARLSTSRWAKYELIRLLLSSNWRRKLKLMWWCWTMAVNGWTVMKDVLERKKVEKGMKVRLKIV